MNETYPERQVLLFAMDRPECLDSLTDRERRILVARLSHAAHQQRSTAQLAEEYEVSRGRILQILSEATRKIRRFMRDDARKCPHCDGRGWV